MTKLNATKKFNIALSLALVIAIATSPFTVFAKECNKIRKEVLRLHIIPNSNAKQDQKVKLIVRDKILQIDEELFANSKNLEEAKQIAKNNTEYIRKIVLQTLKKNGFDYDAQVTVCKMFFDTREYENFTMPAGKYDAIRITLGEAKGKNWWCVLYPTLCVPAASKKQDLSDVLTASQMQMLEGKSEYELRFASVELLEKLKEWLANKK